MRGERTEAVVLNRSTLGEGDLVVELFTERWGRIYAVAKGGRKSRRRFMNRLEPFGHIQGIFAGRKRGFMLIEGADITGSLFRLTDDLKKTLYAYYAVELVHLLTPLWDPHPEVLRLLVRFFRFLEGDEVSEEHLRFLELKMLSLLGYRPRVERCVRCGDRPEQGGWFSLRLGGILCQRCRQGEDLLPVSEETLRVLSSALRGRVSLPFPQRVREESRRLLQAFIRYQTDSDLNTLKVMEEVGI